jgi:hypothetical protein
MDLKLQDSREAKREKAYKFGQYEPWNRPDEGPPVKAGGCVWMKLQNAVRFILWLKRMIRSYK